MASKPLQPELRIVLVGKTGAGKTSFMNALMGKPQLTPASPCSDTTKCKTEKKKHGEQEVVVINTPGVYNTKMESEEVVKEIVNSIAYAAPGPHVFLYVLKPQDLTNEDDTTQGIIQEIFGEEYKDYTLALFTDQDETPEIDEEDKNFIKTFGGRYHFFDSSDGSPDQVSKLLEKINNMVKEKGGKYYTNEMFKKAQKVMESKGLTPDVLGSTVDQILELAGPFKDVVKKVVDSFANTTEKWVAKRCQQ